METLGRDRRRRTRAALGPGSGLASRKQQYGSNAYYRGSSVASGRWHSKEERQLGSQPRPMGVRYTTKAPCARGSSTLHLGFIGQQTSPIRRHVHSVALGDILAQSSRSSPGATHLAVMLRAVHGPSATCLTALAHTTPPATSIPLSTPIPLYQPNALLQAASRQGQHSCRSRAPHGNCQPTPPRPNHPTATLSPGSIQPPTPRTTPTSITPTVPVAGQAARYGPALGNLGPGHVASRPGGVPLVQGGRTAGRLPPTHMEGQQQGGCQCRGVPVAMAGCLGWRQGSERCSAHRRWVPSGSRASSGRRRAPWPAAASMA